jgi:hypothetical protein
LETTRLPHRENCIEVVLDAAFHRNLACKRLIGHGRNSRSPRTRETSVRRVVASSGKRNADPKGPHRFNEAVA